MRARASCGPSFFVAGGGREGHWSGVRAYFYIPKKRLLQSTLCGYSRSIAHISVWACLACVPDAEAAWQHRGAQGLSRRSGSAWTPPFAQGCALGKPPCHTSVCTQHQVARSQAQEGAPLLAGCAHLTLGAACSRLRRFHRSCRFPSPPRPPPPRSCNHVPGVRLRA